MSSSVDCIAGGLKSRSTVEALTIIPDSYFQIALKAVWASITQAPQNLIEVEFRLMRITKKWSLCAISEHSQFTKYLLMRFEENKIS
jgi:hypothetical protein